MSCAPSTVTTFPVPRTPASTGAATHSSRCLRQHGIIATRHAPPPAPQVAELAPGPKPLMERALPLDRPKLRPARTDAGNLVARRRKASRLPLPSTACASAFSNGAAPCIRWASCAPSPSHCRRVPHGLGHLAQGDFLGKAQDAAHPKSLCNHPSAFEKAVSVTAAVAACVAARTMRTVPVKVHQVRPSVGSGVQQRLS